MAISPSAVARVVGVETVYKDLKAGAAVSLPQRIAVIGQGSEAATYPADKKRVTSAYEVGVTYGFGSPVHLAALKLFPVNGGGVGMIPVTIFPLDKAVGATAAVGDITPTGSATVASEFRAIIGGVTSNPITITVGMAVSAMTVAIAAAINAVVEMPVIAVSSATDVTLTSKWNGESANDIKAAITGPTDAGVSFALTQPTGGATNPDITTALALVGDVWETMVLNCFNSEDETILDALSTFGETRWGELVKKPLVSFVGSNVASVSSAIAVTDTRVNDRTNIQLVAPGSDDLPLSIAAAQLAKIAVVADSNPAKSYGSQSVPSIDVGEDGEQWDYTERNLAVTSGSSTITVRSGVATLEDIVTMYHPEGDPLPAYRKLASIVKLMNIVFNLDLIFSSGGWAGAPLIPDGQATENPDARSPRSAVAAIANLADSLALNAIIADPEFTKNSIVATINATNPDRLDIEATFKVSGNSDILAITNNWGFNFGSVV